MEIYICLNDFSRWSLKKSTYTYTHKLIYRVSQTIRFKTRKAWLLWYRQHISFRNRVHSIEWWYFPLPVLTGNGVFIPEVDVLRIKWYVLLQIRILRLKTWIFCIRHFFEKCQLWPLYYVDNPCPFSSQLSLCHPRLRSNSPARWKIL